MYCAAKKRPDGLLRRLLQRGLQSSIRRHATVVVAFDAGNLSRLLIGCAQKGSVVITQRGRHHAEHKRGSQPRQAKKARAPPTDWRQCCLAARLEGLAIGLMRLWNGGQKALQAYRTTQIWLKPST